MDTYCFNCEKERRAEENFCFECGEKLPGELYCGKCESPVKPYWNYCTFCGEILELLEGGDDRAGSG